MTRPAANSTRRNGTVRCAIYTRKSSEEGLEQEFNSLQAQREACEAFIKCHPLARVGMMVTLAMSVASGAVRIKALFRCAAEPMPSAQRSWRKPAQSWGCQGSQAR
jgi:hypothetical protein